MGTHRHQLGINIYICCISNHSTVCCVLTVPRMVNRRVKTLLRHSWQNAGAGVPPPPPPSATGFMTHAQKWQATFLLFIFRCIDDCFQGGLKGCGVCVLGSLPYIVADPGCLSRILLFSISDPGSQIRVCFHPGSASKNLSILTQNNGL